MLIIEDGRNINQLLPVQLQVVSAVLAAFALTDLLIEAASPHGQQLSPQTHCPPPTDD
jgi:hypothetical protein